MTRCSVDDVLILERVLGTVIDAPTNRTALSGQEGHEKLVMEPFNILRFVGVLFRTRCFVLRVSKQAVGCVIVVVSVHSTEELEVEDDLHSTFFHVADVFVYEPEETTRLTNEVSR